MHEHEHGVAAGQLGVRHVQYDQVGVGLEGEMEEEEDEDGKVTSMTLTFLLLMTPKYGLDLGGLDGVKVLRQYGP